MSSDDVTITLHQSGDRIDVDIWSPAFVDRSETDSVEDALVWAQRRLDGANPFEPYDEEPGP